ncbi:hypothetical protein LXA43DRAFT_1064174 [Ganoderma leucocontextum]|nr:hypothetical protein LXA43DRAFT_1064174 [Ganoderma leucocontextum]
MPSTSPLSSKAPFFTLNPFSPLLFSDCDAVAGSHSSISTASMGSIFSDVLDTLKAYTSSSIVILHDVAAGISSWVLHATGLGLHLCWYTLLQVIFFLVYDLIQRWIHVFRLV